MTTQIKNIHVRLIGNSDSGKDCLSLCGMDLDLSRVAPRLSHSYCVEPASCDSKEMQVKKRDG